jgi:hypothetical protein
MRAEKKDSRRRPDWPRRGRVSRDHGTTLPFGFKKTMDKPNSQHDERGFATRPDHALGGRTLRPGMATGSKSTQIGAGPRWAKRSFSASSAFFGSHRVVAEMSEKRRKGHVTTKPSVTLHHFTSHPTLLKGRCNDDE